MDNILLVDIGNTSVKWALKNSDNLLEMLQQQYPHNASKVFFIDCLANIDKPDKVIVTCVASTGIWTAFEASILALWGIKPERVVAKAKGYGLINGYVKPAELGSDRWCVLIGAYHASDSNIIVIDCGSAITIDIVNRTGKHLGGYIVPGLRMMKQSLGLHTAQIEVNNQAVAEHSVAPARTTSGCVDAGVNLAAVSMIEAIITQQSALSSDLKCFITGGDAGLVAEHLTTECVNIKNLVIRGLAFIAESDQA
ncbi:MAG: type III pantothenate kinase [Gammaproteobacteria bacterium]|nr:type III pantothenate kinase [Gammaproteobacteria bacterium]MCW9031284.1 type III pantothenate kinase [Gammaproteobacteria bacterium]